MEAWVEAELRGSELGDERLSRRLGQILDRLAGHPQGSLPQACVGWAELMGAYRFFGNKSVDMAGVLSGHRQATLERMKSHPVVLCLQDTTFVNFGDCEQTGGLGPHSRGRGHGLCLHPVVAVSEAGEMLGCVWAKTWAKAAQQDRKASRHSRGLGQKESVRWVEGVEAVNQVARAGLRRVVVGDRESDLFEIFAQPRQPGVHLLVRMMHNRRTAQGKRLLEVLEETPVWGQTEVAVSRRDGRPQRLAQLQVRAIKVGLPPPAGKQMGAVTLWAVEAREEAKDGLHWILWTDLPVGNMAQAVEKLQWYRQRWQIERFFDVLKNGSQLEELQLTHRRRLESALGVYLIVAWRVLALLAASRQKEPPATETLLSAWEWQAAWGWKYRRTCPTHPPPLVEMVALIAQLGGYLGRKNDGPPGARSIWKGLRRVHDIALGMAIHQTASSCV